MRIIKRIKARIKQKTSKNNTVPAGTPAETQTGAELQPEQYAETYQGLINRLAGTLLRRYVPDSEPKKNLVFSPYSILTLLYMAADATAGTTRDEILSAAAGNLSLDEVRRMQAALTEAISGSKELLSSNAVCVQEKLKDTINPAYPETLRKYFSGELFSSSDMITDVNAWVREKTNDMIDGILDETMEGILLCLANAVAFQADWERQYDEEDIYDERFVNADGTSVSLPMLHSTEEAYVEDDAFTGFVKPYRDGRFSFMALLPKDESYDGLVQASASVDFSALYQTWQSSDVHVFMPEFTCDFKDNLTDFCKGLGIREAFSGAADFSPLSSAWLKADALLHKAHIEVDRKGTKAAAVSAMVITKGCFMPGDFREYKTVELNRPYIYAIIHNETAIPVFVGMTKHIDGTAFSTEEKPADGQDLGYFVLD